jgi:hypothetical protein
MPVPNCIHKMYTTQGYLICAPQPKAVEHFEQPGSGGTISDVEKKINALGSKLNEMKMKQ